MGVTNSNKVVSTDRITCDGSLRVTLALTAVPDIVSNPTDIVLVLGPIRQYDRLAAGGHETGREDLY